MTKYKQGQAVSYRRPGMLNNTVMPGSSQEHTGTIKQVLVERGNAANRNTSTDEDDARYEVLKSI
ncbi:hypothetical protein N7497_003907 [Penicillium chrysogenum]|nr:hypothetical protein N7497_003907 [Penicillium chrysogenum]